MFEIFFWYIFFIYKNFIQNIRLLRIYVFKKKITLFITLILQDSLLDFYHHGKSSCRICSCRFSKCVCGKILHWYTCNYVNKQAEHLNIYWIFVDIYIFHRFESPRFSDQNARCLSSTLSKTYLHFSLHNFNQTWHNSFGLTNALLGQEDITIKWMKIKLFKNYFWRTKIACKIQRVFIFHNVERTLKYPYRLKGSFLNIDTLRRRLYLYSGYVPYEGKMQ